MDARLLAALILPASLAQPATPQYWMQAVPQDPAETELREALAKNAFAGPAVTARALESVSASHPGTSVSGLAQLAAGLLLLDANLPQEAVSVLRDADISRTPLNDRALFAIGQAQETSGAALAAASSYLAAADASAPGPVVCAALLHAGDAFVKGVDHEKAASAFERASRSCPGQESLALFRQAEALEAGHALKAAADLYDRLDRDYPASHEALATDSRRQALLPLLKPESAQERRDRQIKKALSLLDALLYPQAAAAFRLALSMGPSPEEADLLHARLGKALSALGRPREAHAELALVRHGSAREAEAAYLLARLRAQLTRKSDPYEAFATSFPDSPFAEDALVALANHYQKDARDQEALPYYRRLLQSFPDGRFRDRATWHVAWADYKEERYDEAAQLLERAVRLNSSPSTTPGFLYWAGRSRLALGQKDRGVQILGEAVQRFKYTYHGHKAQETLSRVMGSDPPQATVLLPSNDEPRVALPEPLVSRVRALLLIDRLDLALEELQGSPRSPGSDATAAWIEWRLGKFRPAISAMRRAYPEALGEGGDRLPDEVWRILYPIQYREALEARAQIEGVDAALVAALICQESTFDPGAVSRAGARGLMQMIPRTGMLVARGLHVPWRGQVLMDPLVSLEFGTHYLGEMLVRFGGRVERALAAYNAGPERVEAWTASNPDMSAEEFVESIPFTETHYYVMAVLGAREQYRRLYSLRGGAPEATTAQLGKRQ